MDISHQFSTYVYSSNKLHYTFIQISSLIKYKSKWFYWKQKPLSYIITEEFPAVSSVYTFFFFLGRNSVFSELKMEVFNKIWWQGQSWRNQKHLGGLITILINWRIVCNNKRKTSTKRLLRRKRSYSKYRLINIKYSIYKSCFIKKEPGYYKWKGKKKVRLRLDLQIKSKISFTNNKMPVLEISFFRHHILNPIIS